MTDEATGVTTPVTTTFSYTNDSLGQRVEVLKDGSVLNRYIYNSQNQLIAELLPNGVLIQYIYATQNHSPDYMIKNGIKFKLIKDQLGSIRLVVNTINGNIKSSVEYDEFGRIEQETKLKPNMAAFGFAGGIRDPGTGLVRFGARDYDSQIGRWTAKDPIGFSGGDSNLYGYILKDPINSIDPEGKFLIPILAFGIAGAVGAGYGAYLSGASRSGIFKSVLIGFAGGALGGLGGTTVVGAIAGGLAGGLFAGFSAGADVVKPPTPINRPVCNEENLP